jgi:hypothetical protein
MSVYLNMSWILGPHVCVCGLLQPKASKARPDHLGKSEEERGGGFMGEKSTRMHVAPVSFPFVFSFK